VAFLLASYYGFGCEQHLQLTVLLQVLIDRWPKIGLEHVADAVDYLLAGKSKGKVGRGQKYTSG
jgi:hypothetical protein